MKSKISIKYSKILCFSVLCMAIVMMLSAFETNASDEQKNIIYQPDYTYSSDTYKDPTGVGIAPDAPSGYLFAGWYTSNDEINYKAVKEPETGKIYYAKFVPEEVLSIQAQVSGTLVDNTTDNDATSAIRFLTSIDSTSYEKIGFNIKKGKAGEATDVDTSQYVYKTVYAVDATRDNPGEALTDYKANEIFHSTSVYFKTWTIKNIKEVAYNTDITVTPYWITLDGTRVEGTKSIKTVNLGRSWVYVNASPNTEDSLQFGTRNHPFTKFDDALDAVLLTNNGKIIIQENSDIETASDFTWEKAEKTRNITITGEDKTTSQLDFSAISTLNINDGVKFENMTLTLPTTVYANGNDFVINSSVISDNGTTTIFGGGNKATLTSGTKVEIHAGNYKEIWGGNKDGGSITGDIHVTVTNANVFNADKSDNGRIFGGSNGNSTINGDIYVTVGQGFNKDYVQPTDEYDVPGGDHKRYSAVYGAGASGEIVKGNTHVTIEGDAKVDYVYGGVASSATGTVKGTCYVTLNGGTVFSIYGGSAGDTAVTDATKYKNNDTSVVIEGGEVWQIIGGNGSGMAGNTYVEISGGTVHRRIFGGCYNDNTITGTNYVTGDTIVAIKNKASVASLSDGMTAGSCSVTKHSDEKAILICNNNSYEELKLYSSYNKYDYLVQANDGGKVSALGRRLRVEPDENYCATINLDSIEGTPHAYFSGTGFSMLPDLNSNGKRNVYVNFSQGQLDNGVLNAYEAKVGGTYFDTLENAIAEAKELSDVGGTEDGKVTVTLLKDVEIDTVLSVGGAYDIILQSETNNKYSITTSDTGDNVITVYGTLTINNVDIKGGKHGIYVGNSGKLYSVEAENLQGVSISNTAARGLFVDGGTVELYNFTVSGTTQQALFFDNEAEANISEFSVTGNSGQVAVRIMGGADLALNGGTIYANTGYGIYMDEASSKVNAVDTKVIRATGENALIGVKHATAQLIFDESENGEAYIDGNSYEGRGVDVISGTFFLNGGTIRNNKAASGAGVNVQAGATFTMTGGTISGNTATTTGGGGVYVAANGTFNMNAPEVEGATAGAIQGNVASNYGAGVLVYGNFNMNAGIISNHGSENNPLAVEGTGVCLIGTSATFTMNGGEIKNNYSTKAGVGVSMRDGNKTSPVFTMNGGAITANHASGKDSNVGGIVVRHGVFEMNEGAIISNNTASKLAGGMSLEGSANTTFIFNGGIFENNTAGTYGHDIYLAGVITLNKTLASDVSISPNSYSETKVIAQKGEGISDEEFKTSIKCLNVEDKDGHWFVNDEGILTKGPVLLQSTGKGYATLSEALEVAAEEDTITILENTEIANTIAITKNLKLTSDKAVTVTANDTLSGNMFNITSGTLEITGISEEAKIVIAAGKKTTNIIYTNGGNATLENVELAGNQESTAGNNATYGIYNNAGTVTAKSVIIKDIVKGDGINIRAGATANLDNVTISNTGRYGIKTYGTVNIYNTIHKDHALTISNTYDHGIDIDKAGTVKSNLEDVPNDTYAIRIDTTRKVDGARGIIVRDGASVNISDLNISGTKMEGIYFGGTGAERKITKFNIENTGNPPVSVVGTTDNVTLENGTINGGNKVACLDNNGTVILNGVNFLDGKESDIKLGNSGMLKLSAALTSNIRVVPSTYAEGTSIVEKHGEISDENFHESMRFVVVAQNGTDEWHVNDEGKLTRTGAVLTANSVNIHYASLEEALTVAEAGSTIKVCQDATITNKIEKAVKLKADKAVTITAADTLSGGIFNITQGTLEIKGTSEDAKIVIAAGKKTTNIVYTNGGNATLENVELAGNQGSTVNDNSAYGIYNNAGRVVAKSVIIKDIVKGDGINVRAGATVDLDNVTISNTGRYGIKTYGTVNIYNTIQKAHALTIQNTFDHGIDAQKDSSAASGGKVISHLTEVPDNTYAIKIDTTNKSSSIGILVREHCSVELSNISIKNTKQQGVYFFGSSTSKTASGSISDFEVVETGVAAVELKYSSATLTNGTITTSADCIKTDTNSKLTKTNVTENKTN